MKCGENISGRKQLCKGPVAVRPLREPGLGGSSGAGREEKGREADGSRITHDFKELLWIPRMTEASRSLGQRMTESGLVLTGYYFGGDAETKGMGQRE